MAQVVYVSNGLGGDGKAIVVSTPAEVDAAAAMLAPSGGWGPVLRGEADDLAAIGAYKTAGGWVYRLTTGLYLEAEVTDD